MRMLMQTKVPHAKFNAAVKDGTAGQKIQRILEETKPEAVYFTEYDGHRGAIMIVNVDDPSKVPALTRKIHEGADFGRDTNASAW